jgi:hypothetical protein
VRKFEPEDPDRIDRPIRSEARGHAGERRLRRILVDRFQGLMPAADACDDAFRVGGPDEGLGLALWAPMKRLMAA